MADIYQFAKSEAPQSIDLDTPFSDSQWNYINDIRFVSVLSKVKQVF